MFIHLNCHSNYSLLEGADKIDDLAQAADLYSQASDLLSRTGSYRFQSITQHNLALVSMALGDVRGARSALEESIRLSRLHGYPDDEAEGLATLADLARLEGEYQEAAGLLERSLALSRQTGHLLAEAAALHSMGLLWMARGDYRKAEGYLGRSLAAYVELDQLPNAVDVQEALARTLTAAGDLRGGVRQLQIAQRMADSLALPSTPGRLDSHGRRSEPGAQRLPSSG